MRSTDRVRDSSQMEQISAAIIFCNAAKINDIRISFTIGHCV